MYNSLKFVEKNVLKCYRLGLSLFDSGLFRAHSYKAVLVSLLFFILASILRCFRYRFRRILLSLYWILMLVTKVSSETIIAVCFDRLKYLSEASVLKSVTTGYGCCTRTCIFRACRSRNFLLIIISKLLDQTLKYQKKSANNATP